MKKLTTKQIDFFQDEGYLIIRDFYPKDKIQNLLFGIYQIIGKVIERHNLNIERSPFGISSFDEGFSKLIEINRSYGAEVYDAVKQIPTFLSLIADPIHESAFISLRNNSIPGIANGGFGIRIDNPKEDKFRAMWHQEYPAQLRSEDGIVFWSPLVNITNELGPVQICPKSHKEGILPVEEDDSEGVGRKGAYLLKLSNEEQIIKKYQIVSPLTKPTDLIIMDFLTLHASGYNRSSRSRWSMQFRYFNFNHYSGMKYGWKGSFASGTDFKKICPELVTK